MEQFQSISRIADLSTMKATFPINEGHLSYVEPGMKLELDGDDNNVYSIEMIEPSPVYNSINKSTYGHSKPSYNAVSYIDNNDGQYLPDAVRGVVVDIRPDCSHCLKRRTYIQ